ncbi:MAG: putative shikimate [Beijerinckiaceae bacterium]|nr:MAG: putative shikimate [Beijerinckiaceae bacterium]
MITGRTSLIAHIGFPTESFKAPMIYNPYFEQQGIDTIVVPMGCTTDAFPAFLPALFSLTNMRGALITMPHKVSVMALLDDISIAGRIAGACNAVKRRADGALVGDMFDGAGFVRGLARKGCIFDGRRALVVGSGGVGSAIAASLAATGLAEIALFDVNTAASEALATRLKVHHPTLRVGIGRNDPDGFDIIVNATPLGMKAGDPMPMDVTRISPRAFVGEVVMKQETTAFLDAAIRRGCTVQVGIDMLFEMIPAYLEFFGFPTTTPDALRAVATIQY